MTSKEKNLLVESIIKEWKINPQGIMIHLSQILPSVYIKEEQCSFEHAEQISFLIMKILKPLEMMQSEKEVQALLDRVIVFDILE